MAGVDVADAVGREVAFRHHRHFVEGAFDRASVADQKSQPPVAAVYRVAGHQQVAQVARYERVAFRGVTLLQETAHLARAVGDQHRQEVVSVAQSHGDADRQGVDVLQDGGIFDAVKVGGVAQVYVVRGEFCA